MEILNEHRSNVKSLISNTPPLLWADSSKRSKVNSSLVFRLAQLYRLLSCTEIAYTDFRAQFELPTVCISSCSKSYRTCLIFWLEDAQHPPLLQTDIQSSRHFNICITALSLLALEMNACNLPALYGEAQGPSDDVIGSKRKHVEKTERFYLNNSLE